MFEGKERLPLKWSTWKALTLLSNLRLGKNGLAGEKRPSLIVWSVGDDGKIIHGIDTKIYNFIIYFKKVLS